MSPRRPTGYRVAAGPDVALMTRQPPPSKRSPKLRLGSSQMRFRRLPTRCAGRSPVGACRPAPRDNASRPVPRTWDRPLTGPSGATILPPLRTIEGPVPSLFIDGEWTSGASGATSDVVNPSDATVVQQVDVADDADVQRAIAAARRAFDETDWPRTPVGERVALLNRTADLLERDRDKVARAGDAQHGQSPPRELLRRRRRHQGVPLLRGPRGQGDRPDGRHAGQGRRREDRVRADRGVRADRAVELPAAPDQLEGRPGPGGRRHDGHQAGLVHAPDDDPARGAARGGRRPEGRRQPGPRAGRSGWRGAGRESGRRPGLAHRRDRGGAAAHPRLGRQPQARRARARRQEPQHRLRRRRLRHGRRQRA